MPLTAAPAIPTSGSTHFQLCGVQTGGLLVVQDEKTMEELRRASTKAVRTSAVKPPSTAAPTTRAPRPNRFTLSSITHWPELDWPTENAAPSGTYPHARKCRKVTVDKRR